MIKKRLQLLALAASLLAVNAEPVMAAETNSGRGAEICVQREELEMEAVPEGFIDVRGNEEATMPLTLRKDSCVGGGATVAERKKERSGGITGYDAEGALNGSVELPSAYRNRKVSAIRSQSNSSLCWAFAATDNCWIYEMGRGVTHGTENFSPYQLSYAAHHRNGDHWTNDWYNGGGNNLMASSVLMNWEGPALDTEIKYPDDFPLCASNRKTSQTHLTSALFLTEPVVNDSVSYTYTEEERSEIRRKAIDDIKRAIYQYGSVVISFAAVGKDDETNSYYNYEYSRDLRGNKTRMKSTHAVVLTGWDDTYRTKAKQAGAFLIKNSYGEDFGDQGYAWISYEDTSLTTPFVYICEDTVSGRHAYTDQFAYDGCGYGVMMSGFGGGYANVFSAKRTELVGAAGIYVPADGQYTVSLEKNLKNGVPGTGEIVATVSGTKENMGFYTISFNRKIRINAGETFSIVVDTRSGGRTCQFYEGKSENIKSVSAEERQSFVDVYGEGYADTTETTQWGILNNACIRAYANPIRFSYRELALDGKTTLFSVGNK
jgi:C1A family cysteine protease